MKKFKKKQIIAFLIFIFMVFASLSAFAEDKKETHTPEPYAEDEFPLWQKDLRRFEIITFGSMPFVSLLSFWSYDIIRSIQHKGDPAYNPWPIKNPNIAVPLSESEQKKLFASIVGISFGIALIDLSYRLIKRDVERKRKIKKIQEDDAIQLIPLEDAVFDETKGSIREKNLFIPIKDGSKDNKNKANDKKTDNS